MLIGSTSNGNVIPWAICCSSSFSSLTDNEHNDEVRIELMTLSHFEVHWCTEAASGLTAVDDGIWIDEENIFVCTEEIFEDKDELKLLETKFDIEDELKFKCKLDEEENEFEIDKLLFTYVLFEDGNVLELNLFSFSSTLVVTMIGWFSK